MDRERAREEHDSMINLMNTKQHTTARSAKLLKSWPKAIWLLASASAFCLPNGFAQEKIVTVKITETSPDPQAIVISVNGNCSYSADGAAFQELKTGHIFKEGAVVRTGDNARTDLFFRRIGTTVRLQEGTEIRLEKMTRELNDGKPEMKTLLDLRAGRIFTVVRSLVPGSTLEIKNAAGRSVVEGGGGKGRYIITADGTHVTDKDSVVPLKVIGETGITVIQPGQKFNSKEGKVFSANTSAAVQEMIDFDEIQSLAEELTPSLEKPLEDPSEAVVLSAGAKSTYNAKGDAFEKLRVGQVLKQGAVIRSGPDVVIDLFLRRWGTTVRLMRNTELVLEKMSREPGIVVQAMETHLDLREGRIFCFIRIPVPESTFEIKTKAGRSVLKSTGAGRYEIRADGTIVTGKGSFKQLQVFTDHGIVMITPGQKFTAEDGHMSPAAPSEVEMMMIQMDQLEALAEQLFSERAAGTEDVALKN
jgi:hypothetical protein